MKKQRILLLALLISLFAGIFAFSASAEEAPATEERTAAITWEPGFVHSGTGAVNAQATFWRTCPIFIPKAGTVLTVRVAAFYQGSSGLSLLAYWNEDGTAPDSSRGTAGTNEFVSSAMIGSIDGKAVNEYFSVTKSGEYHIYTYKSKADNECISFGGYHTAGGAANAAVLPDPDPFVTYTVPAGANYFDYLVYTGEKPSIDTDAGLLGALTSIYQMNTSAVSALSPEAQRVFCEAIRRRLTLGEGVTQELVDLFALAADTIEYKGISARVTDYAGIRSQYGVKLASLSRLTSQYRVTYGAMMAVGNYRGTDYRTLSELTIAKDAEKGYVPTASNTTLVVVYDSEGAAFATNKHNTYSQTERTFTYSTTYKDSSLTATAAADIGLIYRGFLVLTADDGTEYVFYYNAEGSVFGTDSEETGYGRTTTLSEACGFFLNTYTDEEGEKPFALNKVLRDVYRLSQTTEGTIGVNGTDLKTSGTSTILVGDDTYYNTLILQNGSANKATFSVKNAKEGMYQISMTVNTLGARAHYFYLYNTTNPNTNGHPTGDTGHTLSHSQYHSSDRLNKDGLDKTSYNAWSAAIGATGTDILPNSATNGNGEANPYTLPESYRVPKSLPANAKLYTAVLDVYLFEGDNTFTIELSSAVGAAQIATVGISDISLNQVADADPRVTTRIYARDGGGIYSYNKTSGVKKTHDNGGHGTGLRGGDAYAQVVFYPFTVSHTGVYDLSAYVGNGAGAVSVIKPTGEIDPENLSGWANIETVATHTLPLITLPHSTMTRYALIGSVSLEAGQQYYLRVEKTGGETIMTFKAAYLVMQETAEQASPTPETSFTFDMNDNEVSFTGDVAQFGDTRVLTSNTQAINININNAVTGFYEITAKYNTLGGQVRYVRHKINNSPVNGWSDMETHWMIRANSSSGVTYSGQTADQYAVAEGTASALLGYQYLSADMINQYALMITNPNTANSANAISSPNNNNSHPIGISEISFRLVSGSFNSPTAGTSGNGSAASVGLANAALTATTGTVKHAYSDESGATLLFSGVATGNIGINKPTQYGGATNKSTAYGGPTGIAALNRADGAFAGTVTTTKTLTVPKTAKYRVYALMSVIGTDKSTAYDVTNGVATDMTGKIGIQLSSGDTVKSAYLSTVKNYGITQTGNIYAQPDCAVPVELSSIDLEANVEYTFSYVDYTKNMTLFSFLYLEEIPTESLTVNYQYEDGTEAAPTVTVYPSEDGTYTVDSPSITGYYPSVSTVTETADGENKTVTVTYTARTYTVTVDYYLPNGTKATDSYVKAHSYGETVTVESPDVERYAPKLPSVTGTVTGPLSFVVRYVERPYVLTVNFVDKDGNPVADANGDNSITVEANYGERYYVTLPTIDGYLYQSNTVLEGKLYSDRTLNVTYHETDTDVIVVNAGALSSYYNGTQIKSMGSYALLPVNGGTWGAEYGRINEFPITVTAAGLYRVDMILNTNGASVSRIRLENKTTNGMRGSIYLTGTDTKVGVPTLTGKETYPDHTAVPSTSAYLYLVEGTNKIRVWSYDTRAAVEGNMIAVGDIRFTCVVSEKDAYHADTVRTITDNASADYEQTGTSEGNLNGLSVTNGKSSTFTMSVSENGYYKLTALMAKGTANAATVLVDGVETFVFDDPVEYMNGNYESPRSYEFGSVYLTKGEHAFTLKSVGGTASYGYLFLTEVTTYTVKLNYVIEGGAVAAPEATEHVVVKGEAYAITPPAVSGYKPNVAVVTGTATADETVTVTYTEHKINLSVEAVNPKGEFQFRETYVVKANEDYEITLTARDGYYMPNAIATGTAGAEDATVQLTVYQSRFVLSPSAILASTTAANASTTVKVDESNMLAVPKDQVLTVTIPADIRGSYVITAKTLTATVTDKTYTSDISKVTAVNKTVPIWNGMHTEGRIGAGYSTGTNDNVMAYQYLQAGENTITISASADYTTNDIIFTLLNPENSINDITLYMQKPVSADDYYITPTTGSNTSYFAYQYGASGLFFRNADCWVEYDLVIPADGYYALRGLISKDAVSVTVTMTNKDTGKVFSATSASDAVAFGKGIAAAGTTWASSTSSVDYAISDEPLALTRGTYRVRIQPNGGYFHMEMLRFLYEGELVEEKNDGVHTLALSGTQVVVDTNYYPGFTRKAYTMSIDDGSVDFDPQLVALMNKYGIKASFALKGTNSSSILAAYSGHEIANHSYSHSNAYKQDGSGGTPMTLAAILVDIEKQKTHLEAIIAEAKTNAPTLVLNDEVTPFIIPMTAGYVFDVDGRKGASDARADAVNTELSTMFVKKGFTSYTADVIEKMTNGELYNTYLNAIGVNTNRAVKYGYNWSTAANRFELPESFMYWIPSGHLSNLKDTSAATEGYQNEVLQSYLDLADDGTMKILNIWGHGSEVEWYYTLAADGTTKVFFDTNGNLYTTGEQLVGGASSRLPAANVEAAFALLNAHNIYRGTLSDIVETVAAQAAVTVSENGVITNNSARTVYVVITANGEETEVAIAPNGTHTIHVHTYTLANGVKSCPCGVSENVTAPSELLALTAPDVANYYNNKKSAVSITFDDGQIETGRYATEYFRQYGLTGTMFMVVDKYSTAYLPDLGTDAYDEWLSEWQSIVSNGYLDIGNHSYHHYGIEQYSGASADGAGGRTLSTEIGVARQVLQSYFPNSRLVAFASPGGGYYASENNAYVAKDGNGLYSDLRSALIGEGVYVNRGLNETGLNPYAEGFNMLQVGCTQLSKDSSATAVNGAIDTAIENGGWYVELMHFIANEDGSTMFDENGAYPNTSLKGLTVTRAFCDANFAHIAEKAKTDDVWCASFNDVAAYIMEKKYTELVIADAGEDFISYRPAFNASAFEADYGVKIDRLPDGYDHPLTVRFSVPAEWASVTVTQYGMNVTRTVESDEAGSFVYANIVPTNGTVTVTKAN